MRIRKYLIDNENLEIHATDDGMIWAIYYYVPAIDDYKEFTDHDSQIRASEVLMDELERVIQEDVARRDYREAFSEREFLPGAEC